MKKTKAEEAAPTQNGEASLAQLKQEKIQKIQSELEVLLGKHNALLEPFLMISPQGTQGSFRIVLRD